MKNSLLKNFVQRAMMSSSPVSGQQEMNSARVEDLDFTGLSDGGGSPAERARRILENMTLEEKIDYIGGYRSLGIRALPRHGLPSVWMTDATSGPRSYGTTVAFPAAVAMAASWDRTLIAEAADHIAEATRAKGISILLGPGVNIARIPTCGRNFEYMGEDPFLAGEMAAAYIRSCRKRGVICTVKHLAANNSDYDRHKISSDVDEGTLRELYLPAFEKAVKSGGAQGVMCSYNPVNGVWASENRWLLTEVLREEWGFDGFVISDWNSLYSTAGPLKSGLDLEMPAPKWLSRSRVEKALADGQAAESDLDRMVYTLMRTLFAAGVYDRSPIDPEAREFSEDHEQAALKTALAAPVLLKNENAALPLPEGPGIRIVVCGPNAENSPTMGGGSCHIRDTTLSTDLCGSLKEYAAEGTQVIHLPWNKRGRITRDAEALVSSADAVVFAGGFSYVEESEIYDRSWALPSPQRRMIRELTKRNSRVTVCVTAGGGVETESWISGVSALVHGMYLGQYVGQALASLLLGRENFGGRLPFSMARHWEEIPATAGYPKNYSSTSIGRVAWGQGNPRIRKMRHWKYSEGLMVGYRHFFTAGVEPAFPFGYGLSYTEFTVDNLKTERNSMESGDSLKLSLTLKNTGSRSGREVVQIYICPPEGIPVRPKMELKEFASVELEAGASADLTFTLPPEAFRRWNPEAPGESGKSGAWETAPGPYSVAVRTGEGELSPRLEIIMKSSQTDDTSGKQGK